MNLSDPRHFLYRNLDSDAARKLARKHLSPHDDGELYLQYAASEAFGFDDGRLKTADYHSSSGFGLRGVTGVPSAPGHRARFGGAGTPNQLVVITVIPPAQLTNSNGDTIDVLALTLDNAGNPIRTVDPVTRSYFVGIGGILNLSANQPDGDYSATFQVTANYL
jgi:hypothetical protein